MMVSQSAEPTNVEFTDKEKAKDAMLHRLYGIGLEKHRQIWKAQEGSCANPRCRVELVEGNVGSNAAHTDHEHNDRKAIRGFLCSKCNKSLGYADDNVEKLWGLIEYMESTLANPAALPEEARPKKTYTKSGLPSGKSMDVDVPAMLEMRWNGKTGDEIAAAFRVSTGTICRVLAEVMDFRDKTPPIGEKEWQVWVRQRLYSDVLKQFLDGASLHSMSYKLGISEATAAWYLNLAGCELPAARAMYEAFVRKQDQRRRAEEKFDAFRKAADKLSQPS